MLVYVAAAVASGADHGADFAATQHDDGHNHDSH